MTDDRSRFGVPREDLKDSQAAYALRREAELPEHGWKREVERNLELGLTAAPSIGDRTISTFSRGELPHFAGINTFLKAPYVEDVHKAGNYDAAVFGIPLDTGTTYRAGTRFGPQGVRRISALYGSYYFDLGIDLREQMTLCDLGDVFVIPANIEKAFDQISRAVSHVFRSGAFPIMIGGDHSIGYPCVRGIAPHVNGNIGIIHIDRHVDTQELDMDERMHTTPWFHATNIENAPPKNLVQFGIGGWQVPRAGVKVARERGTTIMTMTDIMDMGLDKALDIAIEVASEGTEAVYLSFDIDSIDAGFVPGTGWPEPGGFTPREALRIVQRVARETNLCAMELVEVSPPYDISDMTALMGTRVICDVLANLVFAEKLPRQRPAWLNSEPSTEPWAL
ncbi:MAG: agmatinase family protein [Capsulimonas sp.]|jgi:agmatinase|uniref:agmatinase family protein n=1 Tax=Capsulimonas sp. TaxID=2494211 RepID=UPI0032676B90|nr:arginase/agmatinase family protein [Capsulimonas sp.]